MVDLSNLFTQITAPFGSDSSHKLPENPFSTTKEKLNFANYKTLNNNEDKYVNEAQQKKMQDLLAQVKSRTGIDKGIQASEFYRELLALKGTDGKSYELNSKNFLQNFNALVSQVKDDPALVNELRKKLVTEFGELTDQQRNLAPNARQEWNEIIYESSLDKLKTQGSTISSELKKLSKLNPKTPEDKKKIDAFITDIKKDFGDVARFNELLNDAGIKYKIDGSEKEGYSIKSTDPNNKTSAIDPKSTKAVQRNTLDTWEKNAEFIKSLDTSEFKTKNGKKEAQKKIEELAEGKTNYSKEELKANLDLLTKAYKYNLDTGEFSKAELDQARMNLIGKVHGADGTAIKEYYNKYKGKTDKPHYESEFSDRISKLNTIAFLRNKGLRDKGIVPRLEGSAKANGYSDVKSATGGEDSALSELIDKSRNWKPKEPEAVEKISNVKLNQLSSANYNQDKDTISFSGKNSVTGSVGLGKFIEDLLVDDIELKDAKGDIIKIEKDKVTLKKNDEKKEIKVEIDNGSGQKIVFGIPLNEITDKLAQELGYENADALITKLSNKSSKTAVT
jgi:hypothetical protein